MPELDYVTVATGRFSIRLPRATRYALLAKLATISYAESIIDLFEAAGTNRPVHLGFVETAAIHHVLEGWERETPEGFPAMLPGLFELQEAVNDDLFGIRGRYGAKEPEGSLRKPTIRHVASP